MAINQTIRDFFNRRMGQVPYLGRLGDQIYALQKGFTEGQTDPDTGNEVPQGLGFSADSVYGFATATATADIVTAGTAVAATAVAWPQKPKMWSVMGPEGAGVTSLTYSSGQATFTLNAAAAGTVTVYFS